MRGKFYDFDTCEVGIVNVSSFIYYNVKVKWNAVK